MGRASRTDRVRVGITDYAQDALGDVVFVQLPEVGASVERDERHRARSNRPSRSRTSTRRSAGRSSRSTPRSTTPRSGSTRTRTATGGSASLEPAEPVAGRRPARRRGLPSPHRGAVADRHRVRAGDAAARRRTLSQVFCTNAATATRRRRTSARRAGRRSESEAEDDTTVTFARSTRAGEVLDDELAVAAGRAPRVGMGVVVVKRGPNAGCRFVARARRSPRPGATPTATSSSTTSPCPAATPSSSATGDGYDVRDVGSLNGTYVNRERIEEAPLRNGDEVQIGKFRLVFSRRGERSVS